MSTIKDVAKEANVSVATVSRVLNSNGYVHTATKELIENAIKKLNYTPNQFARFLSGSKTNIIGVLVPQISSPFYAKLIEGLEASAHNKGYKLMLANTTNNDKVEKDYINIFRNYNVDGLVVATNILNENDLMHFEKPIISVDHIINDNIPSVTSDNISGGKMAAAEMNKSDCKNVLLLRGPSFLITTIERTKGFLDEINKNVKIDTLDYDLDKPDVEHLYKYLENNKNIDGIFATSDILGVVAISSLIKLKRKIPKDCIVIGYDNMFYSKLITPSLTTIEQPITYLGSHTFNTLFKLMNNEELDSMHQVIDVNFKRRESTKNN